MELLATYYRGVLCKTYGLVTPNKACPNQQGRASDIQNGRASP